MPVNERRQHFRIYDYVYFDYRIVEPGDVHSDLAISKQLLGESGQKHMEAVSYFQNIDYELAEVTQALSRVEPQLVHYLNLLNAKIDFLSRHILLQNSTPLKKVNLSLGGMSFKTSEELREHSNVKIVLYTKPKMIPIIIDGVIIYSKYQSAKSYHTAVSFLELSNEQEQLLSQHILQAQAKNHGT